MSAVLSGSKVSTIHLQNIWILSRVEAMVLTIMKPTSKSSDINNITFMNQSVLSVLAKNFSYI